jgi:amidohydrolase
MDYAAILGGAQGLKDEVVRLRRRIHARPELGAEEHETARLAAAYLRKLGIEVRTGVAKTGVVGLLRTGATRTVALRADMDALPLVEQTGLPFASRNARRMHACGHDAHVACLLTTARLLVRHRRLLGVNVKFIFQPSEENPPGGACPMIQAGVLDRPPVQRIFGLHCDTSIRTGNIGIKQGVAMANADNVEIAILGRGGHAARPHESIDAITVAAEVVSAIQTIVSRNVNPVEPAVVTLGTIRGGTKSNIICDRVEMQGTIRSVTTSMRKRLPALIARISKGIACSMGASAECRFVCGYPLLKNHPSAVKYVVETASGLFQKSAVVMLDQPAMSAEDFAYYVRKVPGAFIRLGVCDGTERTSYPWHHPKFDIDEKALPLGVALLAALALKA